MHLPPHFKPNINNLIKISLKNVSISHLTTNEKPETDIKNTNLDKVIKTHRLGLLIFHKIAFDKSLHSTKNNKITEASNNRHNQHRLIKTK